MSCYIYKGIKYSEKDVKIAILKDEGGVTPLDTIGLDLSSPAYTQRPNESDEDWNTRLLDEVVAYVTAPEISAKLEELKNNDPSLWKQITDFIKQLTDWLKSQIGLSDYKGNIMDMSKEEYISALGISVLKDDYTPVTSDTYEFYKDKIATSDDYNVKIYGKDYTQLFEDLKINISPKTVESIKNRKDSMFLNKVGELRGTLLRTLDSKIDFTTKERDKQSIKLSNSESDFSYRSKLLSKYSNMLNDLIELRKQIEEQVLTPADIEVSFKGAINMKKVKRFYEKAKELKDIYPEDLKQVEKLLKEEYQDSRTMFNIVGQKAIQQNQDLLESYNKALDLEAEGKTTGEIELETGWFKENNDWKYFSKEVLQNYKPKNTPVELNKEYKLEEVIENEELFNLYPQLRNQKIQLYNGAKRDRENNTSRETEVAGGFFRNGTIFLNVLREFYDPTGGSSLRPTDETLVESKYIKGGRKGGIPRNLLSTLAHETQHVIQRIEGFPVGGNMNTVFKEGLRTLELNDKDSFGTVRDKATEALSSPEYTKGQKRILEGTLWYISEIINGRERPTQLYTNLLGEVEARSLEYILNLNRDWENTPYRELRTEMEKAEGIFNVEKFVARGGVSETNFSIVGEKATKANSDLLSSYKEAVEMDSWGLSPQEIEQKTGWFKEEGDWKYFSKETLKNFKIKSNFVVKVGTFNYTDVIDNKELIKMYPSLKNVKIEFYEGSKKTDNFIRNANGLRTSGNIGVNLDRLDYGAEGGGRTLYSRVYPDNRGFSSDSENLRSQVGGVIMHETQHHIQEEENFPRGGGLYTLFNKVSKYTKQDDPRLGVVRDNLTELLKNKKNLTETQVKEMKAVVNFLNTYFDGGMDQSVYKLLLGEVEARFLQNLHKEGFDENKSFFQLREEFEMQEGIFEMDKFVVRGEDMTPLTEFDEEINNRAIEDFENIMMYGSESVSLDPEKAQEDFDKLNECNG
jgi:hypothetical protein